MSLNLKSSQDGTKAIIGINGGEQFQVSSTGKASVDSIEANSILASGDITVTGKIKTPSGATLTSDSPIVVQANSSTPALKVTQTGSGNALVIEDIASDTTPFVIDSAGNIRTSGSTIIDTNSSTPALRVTQTGSGEAIRVEDSSNPDATPFTVDSAGNIRTSGTLACLISGSNIGQDLLSTGNFSGMVLNYDANARGPQLQLKGVSGCYIDMSPVGTSHVSGQTSDYSIRLWTSTSEGSLFGALHSGVNSHLHLGSNNALHMSLLSTGEVTINNDPIRSLDLGSSKNKFLNGSFQIDQKRLATMPGGITLGPATGIGSFVIVDRWGMSSSRAFYPSYTVGSMKAERLILTPQDNLPCGGHSMKFTVVQPEPLTQDSRSWFSTAIEEPEISELTRARGSSSALPLSVSFWAKSNVVGKYSFYLRLNPQRGVDVPLYQNFRAIVNQYDVTTANQWQRVEFNLPPDTASFDYPDVPGTRWAVVSGFNYALEAFFDLGTGGNGGGGSSLNTWTVGNTHFATNSVKLCKQPAGSYLQIAGVQLEYSNKATAFETRPPTEELTKCQRYYEKSYPYLVQPGTVYGNGQNGMAAFNIDGNFYGSNIKFNVEKRTTPTLTFYRPSNGEVGTAESLLANLSAGTVTNVEYDEQSIHAFFATGTSRPEGLQLHWVANSEGGFGLSDIE